MVLLHSLEELHKWQHQSGWSARKTCFVPTMGALHAGHVSLIRQASKRGELLVVSILVNPTQFDKKSDYDAYPVTLEQDVAIAMEAGADAVFAPSAEELYGGIPAASPVDYGPLTQAYEGAHRPGHFDGVVAVVDLLFDAVRPTFAFFGEKDLQQVAVVKRLAEERHPKLEVLVGSLVRDGQGLALSSRNARLDQQGLFAARHLSQTIRQVQSAFAEGASVSEALELGRLQLLERHDVVLEYLDAVDARTFRPFRGQMSDSAYVVIAAQVQDVRLIDNGPLRT